MTILSLQLNFWIIYKKRFDINILHVNKTPLRKPLVKTIFMPYRRSFMVFYHEGEGLKNKRGFKAGQTKLKT
jgi:hypothetical protein